MNAKMRAWWWTRQGLDGSLQGQSPAAILSATGWARSVGGSSPYLTFWTRGGCSRPSVDAAVSQAEIHELPSARGCAYVLPAADYALGLTIGMPHGDTELKVARKLGVTDEEVEALSAKVLTALEEGPLEPEAIRDKAGDAVRSLGEEGKKKGVTTTLPVALGLLQQDGRIHRIPVTGRLDQQRYKYSLWRPGPFAAGRLQPEEAAAELARRYFRWTGPATVAEFQWFSGLGAKAVKAAVAAAGAVPVEPGAGRLLLPEDADAYRNFEAPAEPRYSLVGSMDSIATLRRDIKTLLAEEDLGRDFAAQGLKPSGLSELSANAILDRGRLIGWWEFDSDEGTIIWTAFAPANDALREEIRKTEEFIRTDLEDFRSFSLDSPKSRKPRLQALRTMAAGQGRR